MTGGPPRVLYIDDDPGLGRLVCRTLEKKGFAVEHVESPDEGLERLRTGTFAAVALDHHMPGWSGLDVLPLIQELPEPPPVVYVTGSEDSHVAVAALKGGAADYVWKDTAGHFRDLLAEAIVGAIEGARLRRAAEAATREVERLNALLSAQVDARTRERDRLWRLSRDMLAVAGFDGVFRDVNPSVESILGYRPEEFIGRSFRELVHPDDLAESERHHAQLTQAQPVLNHVHRMRHRDGSWRWLAWTAVSEGSLIYGTARDMTEQRALEEHLRQAQRVEALGQLTGGIAHDFNNLLQAVSGSLELVRRRADEPEKVRALADAGLEAAARGARLTAQLLAFSRAQRIEERPVGLDAMIEGMRDLVDRSIGPMIQVEMDLQAAGATVLSDPTQLEMAVLNLAINARDAMPDGGTIVIATRIKEIARDPELAEGSYVELSVSDSGIGMEREVAARALEPFFTTKGPGKGTGLGLSQVFGIARQSRGTVRIETGPGLGTTVRVLLQRSTLPASTDETGVEDGQETAVPKATVMVVDDDPEVRALLAESLGLLGCTVREASDGEAALADIALERPDLLLVDFAMPGLTGAELVAAARARWADLPVVFATGYADSEAIEGAAGADALILRKPFGVSDLARMLREALGDRKGAQAGT
ncbi:hybrid sensor histidine kinase/response regulator [Rubellimicrobium sp. CFH 75288]|uniref:hybrid sensor histidine kinase/response regulator n=1 Tax=Rubellimicrobium sp. CFH 75288 TaxID=2697034 RepID=UPI0014126BFD|nr:hybrid sensor histidine kinase/response regulator [Rubellimicrobium sp. CFH 75288]NAZ37048.1 response regulator [Rubellimicrobium sp. CFH 75288]